MLHVLHEPSCSLKGVSQERQGRERAAKLSKNESSGDSD
jgi:hypothetical protein